MTTSAVSVYFSKDINNRPLRTYNYKLPRNMQLAAGDLVVVPVGKREEFKIATVIAIDDNLKWFPNIEWKWVVQKIDTTAYETLKALDV